MKGKGDNYHLVRNELIQASTQHKAREVSLPAVLSACRAAAVEQSFTQLKSFIFMSVTILKL